MDEPPKSEKLQLSTDEVAIFLCELLKLDLEHAGKLVKILDWEKAKRSKNDGI